MNEEFPKCVGCGIVQASHRIVKGGVVRWYCGRCLDLVSRGESPQPPPLPKKGDHVNGVTYVNDLGWLPRR